MRNLCLAPLLAAAILCLGPHYSDAGPPSEPPPPAAEQLVRGLTEFGLALYGEMARADGNIVMSPLSVSIATAMLDAGAAGQTRAEIAAAARFGLPEEQLHIELQSLIRELSARVNKWAKLSFANGVWIDQRCAPSDDYRQLLARCYGATPETLRFGEHPEEACAQINGFVLEHTRGRIPSVVDPDMFSDWTRFVLADAVYFLGAWRHRFRKENTREEPFYLDTGEAAPVSMMHQSTKARCYQDDSVQVLEMPYQGSGLSMLVVLPASPRKLADLEAELSPARLSAWVHGLADREVDVAMPRFEVSRQVDLIPLLSRLGVRRAFMEGSAELQGLCTDRRVYIDLASHQAVLGITEEGTEAAAVTIFKMTLGEETAPNAPVPFRVDHPFLFVLRDMEHGVILFMGRFAGPSS